MFSLKSFTDGWNRFFYSQTDATALCLFRIMFGFFLFLNGISLVEDFEAWFGIGDNSLVPLFDSFTFYGDARINIFKWLSPTELSAWFVLITYIVTSIGVMIGFKTRISTIICFVLMVSLQNRNYAILNSGDTIMRCLLFLMIFAPTQVKFSVDAYLREKSGEPYKPDILILPLRLMQLQFSLVYFATTLFKLKGYDWVDGTAVYYTSRLVNFQRIVLPFVFDFPSLVKFATWSALFIEFAMGTLVWVKELRIWVLLSGILLHLGIEVSMSIGFFEWVMIAGYILFLEPDEVRWFTTRFKRLLPEKMLVRN
ncbi:HTTM domain-containing protein [Peredibacter starrii]|uniref:HTTM domain-containing protein n=2 Tax=Peredibacter starrii TaxID=28202 RepID=A0AAX4HRX5_9BACT|nr:HTTM domain-containing protein [Peredibacter starrii]WPU65930.1 HTTM domain-containing protein [Peredibacter starrii]